MKNGWNRLVWSAAAGALAVGLWAQGAGAAEVKNVTAAYAWPWGVELHYEVVGTLSTNDPLVVTATDRTKNVSYTSVPSALSGDTGTKAGAHKVLWELDKQGIKIESTNVVFTVEYRGAYLVVDLSAGANATSYPVTYLDEPPSGGFNTDAYKTTKLVLRRIEAGTFMMGDEYQTTLTKPYYMGVFEVTQKQYELVTGNNPSYWKGDMRPVEWVSWNDIRGNSDTYNWPNSAEVDANSFMGRLRARTGLEFDLPTEAQWEYACRAGTTSDYNNGGNSVDDLNQLGRYHSNRSDGKGNHSQHTTVGSYLPNAWGLYDMHGNVWEWCLDWYGNLTDSATDPVDSSSESRRVGRGGSWYYYARTCTSYSRHHVNPTHGRCNGGFRLVGLLAEEKRAQTISLAVIGAQTPAARVELSAKVTSGLAVTFEVVSGPGKIEGNVLSFTGTGTVEVRAVQAGDDRWLPASATQTVTVARGEQTITFEAIGAQLATNRVELAATATSGLAVTFEVVSGPGKIEGNVLSFTGAGAVVVRAVQAGNDQWLPATATQTVVVEANEAGLYLVVDLSGGAEAETWPVEYWDEEPEGGFNTDEYKTTKLVLRRVEAGRFTMGSVNITNNQPHQVTLTKPYYIGVFQVTQRQYELVTGSNPSAYVGDKRPVDRVVWNRVRGNDNWPASSEVSVDSFMGQIRARTGLAFDLPTEAQWEYACRAGTTSEFNNGGNTASDLAKLGRYRDNRSDGKGGYSAAHTTVGSYLPNAWGLYDMHGNVWELCLDWYGTLTGDATDPEGSAPGECRVKRGGSWGNDITFSTSAARGDHYPSAYNNRNGLRLAMTLPQVKSVQTIFFDAIEKQTVSSRVTLSAMATSGGVVTFEVVSGPGKIEENMLSFTGTGVVVVRAIQAGDDHWLAVSSTQTVEVVADEDSGDGLYLVVDLSGGPEAETWPVEYLDGEPEGGFNTDEYKTTKLVLRRIEAGTFTMGSPSSESGHADDETQHKVTLTKPFYIGLFEVTQQQYALVMGSNPSYFSGEERPVEKVSWNTIRGNTNWPASSAVSASSFMGRMRERTGLEFDLPTEAQWEYACRAGTTTDYSYGDSTTRDYMWFAANSSKQTHEVGTKKANAWGLYDMHGNVGEWCLDWYGAYGTAAVTDPKGASSGSNRVKRGGCWYDRAADCRSAIRSGGDPSDEDDSLGFRLSRILSE